MAVFTVRLVCFLSTISSMMAQYRPPPASFYMGDKMGWHEKLKIMHLSEDLLKESLLRMRQIIEIRDEHDMFISFNVGMLMGRIREKYRFMSETYRGITDSYHNATWFRPPGVPHFRPLHFIIALERIHYLELEISRLVDIMVEEATNDLNSGRSVVNQTERRRPKMGPDDPEILLRSRTELVLEEAEKSVLRQRFLMKKLGNPVNMTTAKKRFLRNWPVEESWSLDKYNYNY